MKSTHKTLPLKTECGRDLSAESAQTAQILQMVILHVYMWGEREGRREGRREGGERGERGGRGRGLEVTDQPHKDTDIADDGNAQRETSDPEQRGGGGK